jgi:hypothetical protein
VFVFALHNLPATCLDQSNYLANQHQVFGSVVPFTSNVPGPIKLFSQSTAGVWLCCAFYQQPTQNNQTIFPINSRCLALLYLLPASTNCCKNVGPKPFCYPNLYVLTFLHPILICRVTYRTLVELL